MANEANEAFYFIFKHSTDVLNVKASTMSLKRKYVLTDQMVFRSAKQPNWSDQHPDDRLSLLKTHTKHSLGSITQHVILFYSVYIVGPKQALQKFKTIQFMDNMNLLNYLILLHPHLSQSIVGLKITK